MGWMARVVLGTAVAWSMASVAVAGEVTLEGKMACAKCVLKQAEFKECQNVLLVAGEDGTEVAYYIENNEVGKEFGEVCMETPKAKVTGAVSEKDGRKWLAPSKMEKVKS